MIIAGRMAIVLRSSCCVTAERISFSAGMFTSNFASLAALPLFAARFPEERIVPSSAPEGDGLLGVYES